MNSIPSFAVISGNQVQDTLSGQEDRVTKIIENTYLLHGRGDTINPDSHFLRFPERPSSRIIALPASVGGDVDVHGIKWISSFPDNVASGIPRASAVLILNDTVTGYPFACMESSIISASRTAASAALAAVRLSTLRGTSPRRVGFCGTGLIARYVHRYLLAAGLRFDRIGLYDLATEYSTAFQEHLRHTDDTPVVIHDSAEDLVRSSDLVVFATVAGTPHIHEPEHFAHHPLVLHVSLRDLSPEIILDSYNVTDDVDHCLKADTSPHLTEQCTGNRDFVAGTLYDALTGRLVPPGDRTVVFSPFGLGVLDLALARYVYEEVTAAGELHTVPGFFHDTRRYG